MCEPPSVTPKDTRSLGVTSLGDSPPPECGQDLGLACSQENVAEMMGCHSLTSVRLMDEAASVALKKPSRSQQPWQSSPQGGVPWVPLLAESVLQQEAEGLALQEEVN